MSNRLLSKLALFEKIKDFCADLLPNFESICEHMVEKSGNKEAKKTHFSKQMGFRKKSNIKPMGVIAGVCAGIGGLFGFGVAGPAGAVKGAEVGLAAGIQVGVIAKAEGVLDAAGAKIEAAADKAGEGVVTVAEKALVVAERVADVWSKIFLIGYAVSIAYGGTTQSLVNYREFCPGGMWDSLPCAAAALTSVSFHSFTVATGGCLVREAYKMAIGGK